MLIGILFAILTLGLILSLWIFCLLIFTGVPFVKTPRKNIDVLLERFPITVRDIVYDLGCGDGAVLAAINKKTGATCVGFELSPIAHIRAQIHLWRSRASVRVVFRNYMNQDISKATVVFCFLAPRAMNSVASFLTQHAQPSTRIVSYGFQLPGWAVLQTIPTRDDPSASSFYVYQR